MKLESRHVSENMIYWI